jgi:UDP-glucose 4-epimerase
MYHDLKSLPVVCVRPGNAYGEGQKPFVGQGFIATAIASILQGKEILIFGENGTVRDYVHITDVVLGIMASLDRGVPGQCYNLGTGEGRNNRQILDILKKHAGASGYDIKCRILPARPFDVPTNILDSTKLQEHTSWQNQISIEDGLSRMWSWSLRNADKIIV